MTDITTPKPPDFDERVRKAKELVGETEFEFYEGCWMAWSFGWSDWSADSGVRVQVYSDEAVFSFYGEGGAGEANAVKKIDAQIARLQEARRIMVLMNEHFGGEP